MTSADSTSNTTQLECDHVHKAVGFSIKKERHERSRMESKMAETWDGKKEWKPKLCKICGNSIQDSLDDGDYEVFGRKFDFTVTICNDCKPIADLHYDITAKTKWNENCPEMYKRIICQWDKSLGHININASQQVTSWEYQNKGLYVYGPSGKGKTTAIWKLYKTIEEAHGFVPIIMNAVPLARELAQHAKDLSGPDSLLYKCNVLIIDDFGKEKMTESFSAMIYELINYRYENFKPMIITSKYDSKNLLKRFQESSNDSLGFDICRRISDVCVPVNFDE